MKKLSLATIVILLMVGTFACQKPVEEAQVLPVDVCAGEPETAPEGTLRVSCDYSTIQEAVEASTHGNIISVFPGTYQENIYILGKRITLRSKEGKEKTVLDGGGKDAVVTVEKTGFSGVFDGFTVQNGDGEGFELEGASPEILNCTISNNESYGIYCSWSSPKISRCDIVKNGDDFNDGGGINAGMGSSPVISNCNILSNKGDDGGGIYFSGPSMPKISNSKISGNKAKGIGHGMYSRYNADVEIENCVIEDEICLDFDGDDFLAGGCGNLDCDDHNYEVHPDRKEVPGNSIDDNCNGEVDEYVDPLGRRPDERT